MVKGDGEAAEEREGGTVQSVDRAFDILNSFSPEEPLLSVADLRAKLGLSRPTVYRLLETLVRNGVIRAVGKPQKFALDVGVAKLAHTWFSQVDAVKAARDVVDDLRERTSESIAVFVKQGDSRLCILDSPSRYALSVTRGVGEIGPIWMGASGRAIFAHMTSSDAEGLFQRLPATVDKATLGKELENIRKAGVAFSRNEIQGGAAGVAAPFFDYRGDVAGSLGIFGPEARLDDEALKISADLVRHAAHKVSLGLGHIPAP